MVEGAPGYEHTFLKRAWLRDEGLELDAVVRKGQNDQGDAQRTADLGAGYQRSTGPPCFNMTSSFSRTSKASSLVLISWISRLHLSRTAVGGF